MNTNDDDVTRVMSRDNYSMPNPFSSESAEEINLSEPTLYSGAAAFPSHGNGYQAPNYGGDEDPGRTRLVSRPQSSNASEHTQLIRPSRGHQANPAATEELVESDFTTAWLVAISGPMKGRNYTLKQGRNFIGRADAEGKNNRIQLAADPSVSSEAIIIAYDYMRNKFYVQPGNEGTQISYINDMPLLSPVELNSQDVIALSPATSVRFIKFCDEQFVW